MMFSSSAARVSQTVLICLWLSASVRCVRFDGSRYLDVAVEIGADVSSAQCSTILGNLEETLTAASSILHVALDGRAHFGSFNIFLPQHWDERCFAHSQSVNDSAPPQLNVSNGDRSDITIFAGRDADASIWTQQYGGCGVPGDQIYAPVAALAPLPSKEFVRNWAKYRYGIFDEIGFGADDVHTPCYYDAGSLHVTGCSDAPLQPNDVCDADSPSNRTLDAAAMQQIVAPEARTSLMFSPQLPNVVMFCNSSNHDRKAPTKQNMLCARRSVLDVILRHADFDGEQRADNGSDGGSTKLLPNNTRPQFNYRRRAPLMRYVVIIDNAADMLLRDSWHFLRTALRKWLLYDLPMQSAVGVVLTAGMQDATMLAVTPLTNQTNRDLVASFVPYAPADVAAADVCLSCVLAKAQQLLDDDVGKEHENSVNVILVIAPGMEAPTPTPLSAHIVTLNYPRVLRSQPLDALAHAAHGHAYSVHERKLNGEQSHLSTYVTLSAVLSSIAYNNYVAAERRQFPIEVHRATLERTADSGAGAASGVNGSMPHIPLTPTQRFSQRYNGTFYIDESVRRSAAFYVYTYSAEQPLLQSMRLRSPSGALYETRSDLRMHVKQLSLLANVSETGRWTYEVERVRGNPQPHIVQVWATPSARPDDAYVRLRVWMRRQPFGDADKNVALYAELRYGDGAAVVEANVRVRVQRYDQHCNNNGDINVDVDMDANYSRDFSSDVNNCSAVYKMLDYGAGSADVTRSDGIYTRLFQPRSAALYSFEVWATSVEGRTYANSQREDGGSAAGGRDVPLTPPFERYAAPLSVYVTAHELRTAIAHSDSDSDGKKSATLAYGQITDLRLRWLPRGRLLLRWRTPDLADRRVERYELRYSFSLEAILDGFDTGAWQHSLPAPLPLGAEQHAIIDTTLESAMLNRSVYFALRAYATFNATTLPTQLSNIVGVFVQPPATPSPSSDIHRTSNNYNNSTSGREDESDGASHTTSSVSSQQLLPPLLLHIAIVLTLIFLLLLIFCALQRCRRQYSGALQRLKTSKGASDAADVNAKRQTFVETPPSTPKHMLTPPTLLATVATQHSSLDYVSVEESAHHTIGIPVFDFDADVGALANGKMLQSERVQDCIFDLQAENKAEFQQTLAVAENDFFGGISIISLHADTLRTPATPLNYDSWSQAMLLAQDEPQLFRAPSLRQHNALSYERYATLSPMHQRCNVDHNTPLDYSGSDLAAAGADGASTPPVPPLPAAKLKLYRELQSTPTSTVQLHQTAVEDTSRRMRNVTMV